ncbi:DUF134 domain-containing protein [bacterium]|nr:DUF134 domain-containing protein [bacterium]MBT4597918.1 DUF134 domain-containing protein [bacterium]MBT6753890.1 DUF134 domain-containing protein [bacterium]MBT7037320.1 DUF134 domain-containing protein [bacterium]
MSPRPKLRRKVYFRPKVVLFKPEGVLEKKLKEVALEREEAETLRLVDEKGMSQTEAAVKMNTSQSTLQRILSRARTKIAHAIIRGKAIRIE